jgi:hypothetical protein
VATDVSRTRRVEEVAAVARAPIARAAVEAASDQAAQAGVLVVAEAQVA